MSFTLFQLILITGIIQGLITSALMLADNKNQSHQKLLGLAILILVTINLRAFVLSSNLQNYVLIRYFPLGFELFLPPVLYLYVCQLTQFNKSKQVNIYWHFLLPTLWICHDFIFYLVTLFQNNMQDIGILSAQWNYTLINLIEDHLIILSTWIYLIIGYKRFNLFRIESINMAEKHRAILIRWLTQILIWMFLVGLFSVINYSFKLFMTYEKSEIFMWKVFNIYLAFTTYYLGFLGYRFQSPRLFEAINSLKNQELKSQTIDKGDLDIRFDTYISTTQAYLDPKININTISKALDASSESLSFLLNQKLKTSFRDYINKFRIEEVKKRILASNKKVNTHSILDIALDSGFNSQASFYRAFKKFVKMTPLQYIKDNSEPETKD